MKGRFLHHQGLQISLAVVLALASGAVWYLGILDEKAIQRDSSQSIDDERLTLRRMEAQRNQGDAVLARYDQNIEEMTYFREHFLTRKQERLVAISKFLEDRARHHGLRLKQVDYAVRPSREKDMEVHEISLPLSGRYRDIRGFIASVEASDLFLVISELSLEGERSEGGVVDVQLLLSTYFARGRT